MDVDGHRTPDAPRTGDADVAQALERVQLRLGAIVAALRDRTDWSQDEVARRAGVHPVTVRRIEKTTANPRLSSILSIAWVLGAELEITVRPRR